jgi:hypothetical protein
LLLSQRRELLMPTARYIGWVGTSLLALLFVANWFLPEYSAAPAPEVTNRPIIHIASAQQPPERVVIDTSQPTIIPSPMLFGDAVPDQPSPLLESYASATSPAIVINLDQKKRKVVKRQPNKVAINQPPLSSIPVDATGGSATTAPLTRLSFADIISGRLVKNLFNLH